MSEPRKRQRVPISCLVCKRRKVKCDKVKPVCGVCAKHGVGHLCEYVDPQWSKESHTEVTVVHKNNDQTEKTIQKQRSEIEDLKRKLALLQQEKLTKTTVKTDGSVGDGSWHSGAISEPAPIAAKAKVIAKSPPTSILNASKSSNNGSLTIPAKFKKITVLRKLSPNKNQTIEVEDDIMLSLVKNLHRQFIDVYCWINILRLDEQLSNLWFKIVNLQKIYRIHKANFKGLGANDSLPDAVRCPVMQLDSNTLSAQTPLPITGVPNALKRKQEIKGFAPMKEIEQDHAVGILIIKKIQDMWNGMLRSLREDRMNYKQLTFLLKYYFEGKRTGVDTRHILTFYKDKLFLLINRGENDEAVLSKSVLGENLSLNQKNSRQALFLNLKLRGVYLAMISLIVDETLMILRGFLGQEKEHFPIVDEDEAFFQTFKSLFPYEVQLLCLGEKENKIQHEVQDFLTSYAMVSLDGWNDDTDFIQRIPYIACCILSLNRSICNFNRSNVSSSASQRLTLFATVFPIFINSLLHSNTLAIWANPTWITITTPGTTQKRIKDFQIQICLLWKETIRLVNIVAFSLIPVVRITDHIGDNVLLLLEKIEESERKQYHTDFIKSVPSLIYSTSFSSGFLISRIFNILSRAINGVSIDIELLKSLILECGVWLVDETSTTRIIEEQVILHYIRFFLTFIILIQGEEDMKRETEVSDKESVQEKNCVNLLTKFFSFLNYASKILDSLKYDMTHCKYIMRMLTELMTRIVPIISGILIRMGDGLYISPENVNKLSAGIEATFLKEEANSRTEINHKIIHVTSKLIDKMKEISMLRDERVNLLSRVWNFYMVFINNINRISYSNYAAIHANVPAFNTKAKGRCPVKDIGNMGKELLPTLTDKSAPMSGKCPVDHSTLSRITKEGEVGKCPVDHSQLASGSGSCPIDYKSMNMKGAKPSGAKRARKCPFDYESIFLGAKGGSVNPIESHIRGERSVSSKLSSSTPPPPASSSSTPTSLQNLASVEAEMEPAFSSTTKVNSLELPDLLQREQDLLPGLLNDFPDIDFDMGLDFDMLHSEFQPPEQSIDSLFQ